ncbi:DUF4383 domain-containing protein [Actinoplanes sp. NBRC 103695]|uniref:DUF4383 domain-containing protein n=1 Tax=Actinoplanes sp. NBRC 103695 TaxID=3032202 RepID=UPI0024A46F0E|nr:DUF4383 domain-containing protein [Actinoplanes sp. NBRC 103695]GLY95551.1 hypothetical protein Acsp02_28060 [Actinoplanes sp. NBRC 103695]
MAHFPLNHHLRQTYRFIAALAGLYLLVAGVIGLVQTAGDPFFDRTGGDWALGLRVNPAGSWLLVILGVLILGGAVIGGNVYHHLSMVLGWGVMGIAMFVMAAIQTDVNVLNVSMVNVVVLAAAGLLVLTAGLYGKVERA